MIAKSRLWQLYYLPFYADCLQRLEDAAVREGVDPLRSMWWASADYLPAFDGFIEEVSTPVARYLMKSKKSLLGGLLQKSLGLRAWSGERLGMWTWEKEPCLFCCRSLGGVSGRGTAWYLLQPREFREIKGSFGVEIAASNHLVRAGYHIAGTARGMPLVICHECAEILKALDVLGESCIVALMERADNAEMRRVEQIAIRDLPYRERERLAAEGAAKKKAAEEFTVAKKFEVVGGKLIEVS